MTSLSRLADLLDPPAPPSPFDVLGYEPTCLPRWDARQKALPLPAPCGRCPQEQFHAATEDRVLYGGAAGGGKTKALVMEAIRLAVVYPGITIGVFRRTFPELRLNIEKELAKVGYCRQYGARYNQTETTLRFPSGSEIVLGYLDDASDASRYQGSEFQAILVDELTLMRPGIVDMVLERLRSGDPRIPVIGLRATCNPGGSSHAEVRTRFIEATNHGAQVHTDPHGVRHRFIQAKVVHNPHVDAGYKARLEAIPDPARRAAMLDGDWDTFAGQVFGEWRHDRHVVDPFAIPEEWRRYSGTDYGYAAPWVTLWVAIDPDGRVWVYRELDGKHVGESEQARLILAAEADDPRVDRFADPAMWAKASEKESIAEAYERVGCSIDKANNDRLSGWQRVHSYLADGPACRMHREQGWETCPRLHVFSGCADLIRTLPSLPYDTHRVEDVDTNAEDHWADALRYALMGIGTGPTFHHPSADAVQAVERARALVGSDADLAHRNWGPFAHPSQLPEW